MNTRIFCLFLLCLLLNRTRVLGQGVADTAFGKITAGDFHVSSPAVDSGASVVILEDIGQSTLDGYDNGWRIEFKRYRRLLIRNKKGFEAANITLSFSGEANGMGKLATLRANTYNLDNGKVVQTKVEDEDMFLDSGENERMKERWTFPDVREGSIIEYVYSIYNTSIYSLPSWDFQGEYPRLKSDYTVTFPIVFNYVVTKQGSAPRPQSYENIRKSYPFDVQLTGKHIDSLQAYDQPVTVRYNFAFPTGGDDHLYFTPMLSDALKENYFKDAERQYPIEMPYTTDKLYVLQMDIPHGYEIEELPKPVRVKLNEGEGWFEYGFVSNGQSLQFRSRVTLKRTFFQPEEYQSLRDFFALVVKKQNEPIVFRKKK
jgi:hypothetical protein